MPIQSHWHLATLYVSKKFFQGNIPLEIGVYFPRLMYLNLSRNEFDGSIPSSIGDMNSLKFLDLSHNQLTGEIPEHLAMGCFNLEYLVLSKNSLQGIIALVVTYLHSILIGRLTYLRYLILANNNLEGEVPIQSRWLKEPQLIDLSNNNLFGEIPSCLDNTSLHNNGYNDGSSTSTFNRDVRGTYSVVSSTMEKVESLMFTTKETSYSYKGKPLNKMYGIDLSCNKLVDEIPLQIGNPLLCGKPLPDCDAATVPEASNEENDNNLIDMD
ncbi:hypothetical protein CUMW_250820, partial [Citrus unshiu]